MTPRERVEAVLRGEAPDKIPFTIYESKIPQCAIERQLRNEGLCIVNRHFSVVRQHQPDVHSESHTYTEDGVNYVRHTTHTPVGDLFTISRPAGFTSWHVSRLFKSPDDYRALMCTVKGKQFEPNYEPFVRAQKWLGDDMILRGGIGATPLHGIMISWMGVETFAIEWSERRDEIDKLYHAMMENRRKVYPILAESPCLHFNYGGNETGDVMGRERFQKYVMPCYAEAAEVLHKHGKLVGTHLDGNNKIWADLVGDSDLDYIEAFDPACDMTMDDAFQAWPDKALWINFPSPAHLGTLEQIEATTRQLIRDSAPDRRLLIGITEDIPEDRWQENLLAISRVINTDGRYPLSG